MTDPQNALLERMRAAMQPAKGEGHTVSHSWRHYGYKAVCTCGITGSGSTAHAARDDVERKHHTEDASDLRESLAGPILDS